MAEDQKLYAFKLKQGSTKRFFVVKKFNGVAIDLTGYTAEYQARKSSNDETAALDLDEDGLTITPLLGKIEVLITDEQSAAMAPGIYFADLFVTPPSGEREFVVGTKIIIEASFTR